MLKPFKGSLRRAQGLSLSRFDKLTASRARRATKVKVQEFNRIIAGFLFLTLELLNPLNLERASAQQTPSFYQGKTITWVVRTKAGDAYDLYPRLRAESLPENIPGNSNILIQNLASPASLVAVNQVDSVAKPDGLTVGSLAKDAMATPPDVIERMKKILGM